jgi:hypothetical protein
LRGSLQFGKKSITPATLPLVVALYASDGCRMADQSGSVHGSDAILAQLKAGKDRGLAKVKIAVTSAGSSGDLRYRIGTYEITGAEGSHVDHGSACWCRRSRTGHGKLSATFLTRTGQCRP